MADNESGNPQHYSNLTRFIHLATALAVTAALVISLFMPHPKQGQQGDFWFEVHEKTGLVALGGLVLFWLWAMFRRGEPSLADWFPYLSSRPLNSLMADTKAHLAILRGGKLPTSSEQPLANAVHGLGALIALIMAATGTLGYFYDMGLALKLHEAFTVPMWLYFGGHVLFSFYHEFAHDPVLRNMFVFKARKPR